MPEIQFSHPLIKRTLTVSTGANQIEWSYNLNTVAYPTYGGEVVQVLSTNIDDLKISGDVRSYDEMEKIYRWFLEYMQIATQGTSSPENGYKEEAVTMNYPHRGWRLSIQPKSLPSLRYGRDVVIPSWTLQAAIKDPDPVQTELTIDHAVNGDLAYFQGKVDANIGLMVKDHGQMVFRQANPFSDPNGIITSDEKALYPNAPNRTEALTGLAKQMDAAMQTLIQGSLADIFSGWSASKPASVDATTKANTHVTGSVTKGTAQ